jgi:hypothetical protein
VNIGHDYPARVREGESVFSLEAFQSVTRAVERHDLLNQWQHDKLIQISPFYGLGQKLPMSFLKDPPVHGVRIVVGDTYVDEPLEQFPSERLIATIALLLQARGEL